MKYRVQFSQGERKKKYVTVGLNVEQKAPCSFHPRKHFAFIGTKNYSRASEHKSKPSKMSRNKVKENK